jgi:hypothetical protein
LWLALWPPTTFPGLADMIVFVGGKGMQQRLDVRCGSCEEY